MATTTTAGDIHAMVARVDDRLLPLCRHEGFHPYEEIHRLGDDGYVTEREFAAALADQPSWAYDAYTAEGNGVDADDIAAALNTDPDGFTEWAARMFDTRNDDVFVTEADEHGQC